MKTAVFLVMMMGGILFSANRAYAQHYHFYNLNVEQGLIQSQTRDIAQDKFGNLWIATLGGLSMFDGIQFTNYTIRDGLLSNDLRTIAVDSTNRIWMGGSKGLVALKGKKISRVYYVSNNQFFKEPVSDIQISNNDVWVTSKGKLFKVHANKASPVILPDKKALVNAFFAGALQQWIATNAGKLYTLSSNGWDSISYPEGENNFTVIHIMQDSNHKLWLATNQGLYKMEHRKIVPFKIKNTTPVTVPILSLTEDENGYIWCGLLNGVMRLSDSGAQVFDKTNGLCNNAIMKVLKDKEGNIWMASDGQGVFRFSGDVFTFLDERSGLPSAQIMSVATDGKGKIFIGTYESGLYVFEKGRVKNIPLPYGNTIGIMALKYWDGYLWIGTAGVGLLRYKKGNYQAYQARQYADIPSDFIAVLYEKNEDELLVGTLNGAYRIENSKVKKTNFPQRVINDILTFREDSLLLATSDRLMWYHQQKAIPFITGKAIDSASPQCLEMVGDNLWVGTSDNGLIRYNFTTKQTQVFNKANGMQSDFVYNVMADDLGNIWVGTGYGIHKVFYDGGGYNIQFFGKEQGITGMESNHKAALKTADGNIWFGTTKGLLRYNPHAYETQPMPVSLQLQSVALFGEPVSDESYYDSLHSWYQVPYGLKLPFKKNNLTFTYHAVTMNGYEKVFYRYKIEGVDKEWSSWSPNNRVTYSALPEGKHQLQVQAAIGSKKQFVKTLHYNFEIITPFHKTFLFRLIIFVGCILTGVTIQYFAQQAKQRKQALIEKLRREEQVKIRQRTAEDFHDEVGNKLTRINVLTSVLKQKIPEKTPDIERLIRQIQENTEHLYNGTKDILWSLQPSNDNLQEILYRIRDFGIGLFQDTTVQFHFTATGPSWKPYRLPLDVSRNLMLICKETFNNMLKHAVAKNVYMQVTYKDVHTMHISLSDDGKGFDIATVERGHGLDNISIRAKRIHASLEITTAKGEGTQLDVSLHIAPFLPSKKGGG